jgi:glucose-6-phosphate isomerase, archaeal
MIDKIKPFDLPMHVQIDLVSGEYIPFADFYERRLDQFGHLFSDPAAINQILKTENPLVYDVRLRPFVTSLSDFTFSLVRIYPGKVGAEYYMTRGHYHQKPDQAEINLCLQGSGCLLLESGEGDCHAHWWSAGTLSHIPPGCAHRVVNTGLEPLVYACFYHLGAGHDYVAIEQRGFSYLVLEQDGKPALVPNPID